MYAYRLNENNKTNHLGGFVLIFSIFLVRKKNISISFAWKYCCFNFSNYFHNAKSQTYLLVLQMRMKKKIVQMICWQRLKTKNQLKCIGALDYFCFVLFPYVSDFQFIYIHNVSCNVRLYTICIAFVVSTQASTQWRKKLIWDEDGWLHYVWRVFSNSLNNTSEFPAMTEKYLAK